MLDVLQDLHRIVLPVKYLGHDLHMALRNALLVPQLLQVDEGLIDRLFLPLLVFSVVGLIPHLVYSKQEGTFVEGWLVAPLGLAIVVPIISRWRREVPFIGDSELVLEIWLEGKVHWEWG